MRRRNMYYLTGQPGWMRFGFSPGWVGRSHSGLGPCAQYMSARYGDSPGASPANDTGVRLGFLRSQAMLLEQQLANIKSHIENLEGAEI